MTAISPTLGQAPRLRCDPFHFHRRTTRGVAGGAVEHPEVDLAVAAGDPHLLVHHPANRYRNVEGIAPHHHRALPT